MGSVVNETGDTVAEAFHPVAVVILVGAPKLGFSALGLYAVNQPAQGIVLVAVENVVGRTACAVVVPEAVKLAVAGVDIVVDVPGGGFGFRGASQIVVGEGGVRAVSVVLPGEKAVFGGVVIGGELPVADGNGRGVAKGIVGEAVGLRLAGAVGGIAASAQGFQKAPVVVDVFQGDHIGNPGFVHAPLVRVIGGVHLRPVCVDRFGGGGGHAAEIAAVLVGGGVASGVGDGGYAVFVPGVSGGRGDFAAGTVLFGQGKACGVPGGIVGNGFFLEPVGDACHIVFAVVGVFEGTAAPGDGFDEVAAGIGAGFLGGSGGFHGDQIAVLVIFHGLGGFSHQGNIVEICRIAVALVGADHPDGFHLGIRLFGHDSQGGILPILHVRVEGDVVVLGAIIRVGENGPEAELLLLILGRGVVPGGGGHVIRYGIRLGPAGQHVGLPGLANGHVLVGAAFRVRVAVYLNRISFAGCAVHPAAGDKAGKAAHGPAVSPILHTAVFQQIQIGRGVVFLKLEVVREEVGTCAIVVHPNGVFSGCFDGKGYAQPHPAAVHRCAGLVVYRFAFGRNAVAADLQIHPFSGEIGALGGVYIGGQGVGPRL